MHSNRSIQIFIIGGLAFDEERMQGHPLLEPQLPQINLYVVSKTSNISGATCPTGAREGAAWKARRSCENACGYGLNALPRWNFQTKVPALLSSISPLPHPPQPQSLSAYYKSIRKISRWPLQGPRDINDVFVVT